LWIVWVVVNRDANRLTHSIHREGKVTDHFAVVRDGKYEESENCANDDTEATCFGNFVGLGGI
jgi:hypothetical protein